MGRKRRRKQGIHRLKLSGFGVQVSCLFEVLEGVGIDVCSISYLLHRLSKRKNCISEARLLDFYS